MLLLPQSVLLGILGIAFRRRAAAWLLALSAHRVFVVVLLGPGGQSGPLVEQEILLELELFLLLLLGELVELLLVESLLFLLGLLGLGLLGQLVVETDLLLFLLLGQVLKLLMLLEAELFLLLLRELVVLLL
jgi:hypothetical protein